MIDEICALLGLKLDDAQKVDNREGCASGAYHIISGKGATYFGIGSALAHMIDVIIHDHRRYSR